MIMKEEEGPARAPELYRQETSPDGAEVELAAQFSCSVLKGRESRLKRVSFWNDQSRYSGSCALGGWEKMVQMKNKHVFA